MRPEVSRSKRKSADAFKTLVWPAIMGACGGGVLRPVESDDMDTMEQSLDMIAGIDYWQVSTSSGGIHGIASRVQQDDGRHDYPYNTFTIRYALPSGHKTEFIKRLEAIQQGSLYPHFTCQAYASSDNSALVSVALVSTKDLILYADKAIGANDAKRCRFKLNTQDGVRFIVVPWSMLRLDKVWIFTNQQHAPEVLHEQLSFASA